jgi:hypothetical protein
VIEHWECQWTPHTDTRLIELSTYGATLVEATGNLLREMAGRLDGQADRCAAAGVALLVRGCIMGLWDVVSELVPRLEEWIARDASFSSVAEAFAQLIMLWQSREPLESRHIGELPHVINTAYVRCCRLLAECATVPEDAAIQVIDGCLLVRARLAAPDTESPGLDETLFWNAIEEVLRRPDASPALRGGTAGLLYSANRLDADGLMALTKGALAPASGDTGRQIGLLTGLLKAARELAWREPALLDAVEQLLVSWDDDEFLHRLPHLRVAWAGLTPRESDRVAGLVARRHGRERMSYPIRFEVSEDVLLDAMQAAAAAEAALRDDGLGGWLDEIRDGATPASPP